MEHRKDMAIACFIAGSLVGSCPFAADVPEKPVIKQMAVAPAHVVLQEHLRAAALAVLTEPAVDEPAGTALAKAGFDTNNPFIASSGAAADSASLSPPVTLTYSGGSPVLLVNANGTNKGIESLITNSHNQTSALFGQTNGSGAGLTGYNSGTGGPAGKFGIINALSSQPAVTATTNGYGPAFFGTIPNSNSEQPAVSAVTAGQVAAIVGANNSDNDRVAGVQGVSSANIGFGVEGDGRGRYGTGVAGFGDTGVFGEGASVGISGQVFGNGYGVYGVTSGSGNNGEAGVYGLSVNSGAYGVQGQSTNGYAVVAEDSGGGVGLYASSASGFSGYFVGNVLIGGQLDVGSVAYTSDQTLKQDIQPIDGKEVLDRMEALPVSSWVYKTDPKRRHVGPMAQDFHTAFGLNGTDNTHINVTDIAGLNLAAIKELSMRDANKDAEIADLKSQLADAAEAIVDIKRENAQMQAVLVELQADRRVALQ